MTSEQRVTHRIHLGAKVIPDNHGVTLDLPGQPMMWVRQDRYDRLRASTLTAEAGVGEGALRGYGPAKSAALTAFLALAGNRA